MREMPEVTPSPGYQMAGGGISGGGSGGSGNIDYSVDEQNTHVKWIDGKDIFQKTIVLEYLNSSDRTKTVNIDYDTIIDFYTIFKYYFGTTGYVCLRANRTTTQGNVMNADISAKQLLTEVGADRFDGTHSIYSYTTIFYTKSN